MDPSIEHYQIKLTDSADILTLASLGNVDHKVLVYLADRVSEAAQNLAWKYKQERTTLEK